ncbi:MAG TPA: ABC transporter permease [Humisphaera sp.]|jgi:simple sugar transport system permease protein|nr:ABC transporter permease [Humisphaera sp.]
MNAVGGTIPVLDPPAAKAPRAKVRASGAMATVLYPTIALALLLLFNLLFTAGFFHVEVRDGRLFGSLIDILNRGTPVLLLSLGMTLVIATGGIDLSVGAVMALAGAVAACLIARPEDSPLHVFNVSHSLPLILIIALSVALLAGLFNGILVATFKLQPIVATLILMVAGRGAAQLVTNGQIPTFQHPSFEFLGSGFLFGLPFPLILAVLIFLVILGFVRGSALGLLIEAVGNNPVAARLAGVQASGVKLVCYVISALLAGVAGLIATADIKAADVNNTGLYLELDAILAAAIGGTSLAGGRFSLVGAAVGALVIQTLTTTILARGIAPELTLVIKAAVVVALCLLQSSKFRELLVRIAIRRRA